MTFTWLMTPAGAASGFLTRRTNRTLFEGMLGFAGGLLMSVRSALFGAQTVRSIRSYACFTSSTEQGAAIDT